jgi:hypothetical protein
MERGYQFASRRIWELRFFPPTRAFAFLGDHMMLSTSQNYCDADPFNLQPFDSPFDEEGLVTLKQFDSGTF